jgi:hypothetical protein
MSVACIGVDIGQKHDPTAVVVCEYERVPIDPAGVPIDETGLADSFLVALDLVPAPLFDTRYVVRAVRRLPLGLPYPTVATHVSAICDAMLRRPQAEVYLAVDATGVGAPVVDLIERALDPAVHCTRVLITGSETCPDSPLQREEIKMGKTWMVSRLQALLQSRRIVMPNSTQARELAKELADFEIRVGRDAHAEMGAFKTGTHDDLVTALGLSVLGEAHTKVTYGPSIWGHSS